ncbi:MAG: DUF885 domain-containing protein [Chloroflexota bacterium]|nr:DUF885 domain-containing protein [Chloroflexota bacterium]
MNSTLESNSNLAALAAQFWAWRAGTQPSSGDDIPRIERPSGWTPDWAPQSIDRQRQQLRAFEAGWEALGPAARAWPIPDQVDYRLIGSALARVHWEMDVVQGWRRNPHFYVHQTLGPVFEALLQPPPFDATRVDALLRRADSIPATVSAAQANLAPGALRPFADLAIGVLADIRARLRAVVRELTPLLELAAADQLDQAMRRAGEALENFRDWLSARRLEMPGEATPVGRDAYADFLLRVALVPMSPEQVAAAGQQEFERAVAFEALEQQRNRHLAALSLPATQADQIARQAAGEEMLRQFCEHHDLLSFPSWLRHYRNAPLPAYLAPLKGLGVTDDLTSATRLANDGISYIPEPRPDLPYFYLAMARDPRTLIAHEGMHYYQLARSWAHEDPVRRHYYDSGANEGIGFYAEEMLLQAGLFDDSPRSREIIYNFMRLRAVRVAIDVRLAMGELSIDTAATELATRVPMDVATAHDEAAFFASEPGQAITYQVGKLQILRFLADARLARGERFSLRTFHDALWTNGNVPIALQRWEALGLTNELSLLDRPGNRLPT